MAIRIEPEIEEMLRQRKLSRQVPRREIVLKEVKGAEYDLERARKSFEEGDFKWATVKGYYAIFHAARALLYNAGFRERATEQY